MFFRLFALLYGAACYLVFLCTFVYAIGFVGNVAVPRGIDGTPQGSPLVSLLVDAGLLAVFALQHSIMARPTFKRAWTRIVPAVLERSTFVLAASLALALMFWQWRPLGGPVWSVSGPGWRWGLQALSAFGWLVVLVATFLIDHFALFGLRQVWEAWRGAGPTQPRFATPGFYRLVRHPIYLGFLLAFWATPTMTVTHLVFAVATTAYILVAIQLEERNLIELHPEYAGYRRRVGMLLPRLGRGRVGGQESPGLVSGSTTRSNG